MTGDEALQALAASEKKAERAGKFITDLSLDLLDLNDGRIDAIFGKYGMKLEDEAGNVLFPRPSPRVN